MEFKLVEVSGLSQAYAALKESKRNYDYEDHLRMMRLIDRHTDYRGFIIPSCGKVLPDTMIPAEMKKRMSRQVYAAEEIELFKTLETMAKWGAGVGQEDKGAWYDAGHETLLRFIDFTFAVIGLHRGGMDDLDSHAKRFDNRIVRSSTRYDGAYQQSERSDWYNSRILSTEEVLTELGRNVPKTATVYGKKYVKTANGYVLAGSENDGDVLRGNYPLSIPMDATMKINLVDARHVYMRRNEFTHASPELRDGIEQLADQIEIAIPASLGKLIRYDYALNPETGLYEMAHIMSIKKVIDPARTGDKTFPPVG